MGQWIEFYSVQGTITATGPTDRSDWIPVHRFSNLNISFDVGPISGTNPRMEVQVQFSNSDQATTGIEPPEGLIDFHDKSDNFAWLRVPVLGKWARLKYTVAGTSPQYTIHVRGSGEE